MSAIKILETDIMNRVSTENLENVALEETISLAQAVKKDIIAINENTNI